MAENISKLTLNGSVYDIKDNVTEFKTINGQSIKGEGNITIESGGLDEPTEQLLSTSLVDLNDRKADASELSKYQKKGDYATKTDVAAKANSTDVFNKNYIEEIEKIISASLNELNERLTQLENK